MASSLTSSILTFNRNVITISHRPTRINSTIGQCELAIYPSPFVQYCRLHYSNLSVGSPTVELDIDGTDYNFVQ